MNGVDYARQSWGMGFKEPMASVSAIHASAAIYFFVVLPSITVFQVVPSGDISNLKL